MPPPSDNDALLDGGDTASRLPRCLVSLSRNLRYLTKKDPVTGTGGTYNVYVLALLVIVFILNQADRQVTAVLISGGLKCGEGEK